MTVGSPGFSRCSPETLTALQQADQRWQHLKQGLPPDPSPVVQVLSNPLDRPDWDVVIAGGTLGILLAAVLAQQGWRVALLERGLLKGREQEWNISERELDVLVELDLLTEFELEQVKVTRYNPARIAFNTGPEFWVRDVLNIGVDPVQLLDRLKHRFWSAGGCLLEQTTLKTLTIHPDGVRVLCRPQGADEQSLTTRLFLDVMGHASPLARQARQRQRPEGVCLVVGGCATGIPPQETGDLLYSFTPIQNQCQYFWEAFPAREGRTTYLFTYVDPHPQRLSLTDLYRDYLTLLPHYQGVDLDQIQFRRTLFGVFPSYRQSPLQSPWARVLMAGDSSGQQSPLSFGGFGAMLRHLNRLTHGIQTALRSDCLGRNDLAALQPYQPNLSVTWLFQEAMRVPMQSHPDPEQINRLLSTIFEVMFSLGDVVVKPFLQDVIQFGGLSQTLAQVTVRHPRLVVNLLRQLGVKPLIPWMKDYSLLGLYSLLSRLGSGSDSSPDSTVETLLQKLPAKTRFGIEAQRQAWWYGSGGDFHR